MTRAQSMDVLNDTTTMQSRIDTVLAAPVLDYTNDSGWHPGDPLYGHPYDTARYDEGAQYVRPMFEVLKDFTWWLRCEACEVTWYGPEACWVCGDPDTARPVRSDDHHLGAAMTFASFDETHEWLRPEFRRLIEARDDWSRQMAELMVLVNVSAPNVRFRDPEPITRANTRAWLLPNVEDVNAPTISELREAEPLAACERLLLGLPEEPVIQFPAGAEITPVTEVPLPEAIPSEALTGRRRRPESTRYYLDRPVTERRRS